MIVQSASQYVRDRQRTEVELLGEQVQVLNREDYQIRDVVIAHLKIGTNAQLEGRDQALNEYASQLNDRIYCYIWILYSIKFLLVLGVVLTMFLTSFQSRDDINILSFMCAGFGTAALTFGFMQRMIGQLATMFAITFFSMLLMAMFELILILVDRTDLIWLFFVPGLLAAGLIAIDQRSLHLRHKNLKCELPHHPLKAEFVPG